MDFLKFFKEFPRIARNMNDVNRITNEGKYNPFIKLGSKPGRKNSMNLKAHKDKVK
jgi:hypothetical protein